jgi:hypothetical protein
MRILLVPALAGVALGLSVAVAFADGNPPDFLDVQTWPYLPPGKSASEAVPGQIVAPGQIAAPHQIAAPAKSPRQPKGPRQPSLSRHHK